MDENVFEIKDNELEFNEICSRLKSHSMSSPWKMFFTVDDEADEHFTEVSEFVIDNLTNSFMEIDENPVENLICDAQDHQTEQKLNPVVLDEKKVIRLKESILSSEDSNKVEDLKDVDVFFTVSSNELPHLFNLLDVKSLNEASVTLLLNIFLYYKDKISMTTATCFVSSVIIPIVFEIKRSCLRSLLSTLLQFSELYPKAIIDEMVIPYLENQNLDDQQLELFSQIAKSHLPDDYVSYTIRSIIDNAKAADSSFMTLQILIERRVSLEKGLHDHLLKKLLNWTATFCNNIKFTKLLTSILHVYGSELSRQQIDICDEIILANKTIIKKAAENLLKKIKIDLL